MGRKRLRKWPWVNTPYRQSRTWPPPFRTSCKSSTCSCWLSCNTLPALWNPWRWSAWSIAFSQTHLRLRSRGPAATGCPARRWAVQSEEYNDALVRTRNYFHIVVSCIAIFHIVTVGIIKLNPSKSFKKTYFVTLSFFYYSHKYIQRDNFSFRLLYFSATKVLFQVNNCYWILTIIASLNVLIIASPAALRKWHGHHTRLIILAGGVQRCTAYARWG